MKKLLLIAISFLVFSMSSFAQNNIQLNINHKLGDVDFALETATKNNMDNDFEVTRLQYYISEITIVHDGGTETAIEDLWILVDASEITQIDLGSNDVTSVEMVKFHVGVDPESNHLDPASYEASHPLAPKFPSMHWGWDPGYRFVAFEGNCGINLGQKFELHGLGDVNYFITEIPLVTEAVNNEIIINVDADYTGGLENINVSAGVIVHGDYHEAQQCVDNFSNYVFSAASEITAIVDFSEVSKFDVFPNPVSGHATLILEANKDLVYEVSVTDILGKQIMFFEEMNSNSTIDLRFENAGFYLINLIKEGQTVITEKLISK